MGLVLILALMVGVGIILVFVGLAAPRAEDPIQARLAQFGALDRPVTLEEIELAQPFTERVLMPLLQGVARFISRFTPQQTLERTQHKLDLAGSPFHWGPAEFWSVRLLGAVVAGAGTFVLTRLLETPFPQWLKLTALLVALGFFYPTLWLGLKIRRRQNSIVKSLPDALDLLTICVEAGLGFDAAMAKVAEKWENELSIAFNRVIREIQLGKLRREALRDMSDRMEVPDVASFVAAVIQADQLGVSIGKVLRLQSDQMRVRRRQRAEELARQAAVKILIPVAFLIFPALFIVLLGPAYIMLKNTQLGISSPPPVIP